MKPRIALFARFPEAGRAKTRLIPALGAERAAALHRTLAENTLAVIRESGLAFEIRATGASADAFSAWLGDVPVVDQGQGDLGARMARVPAPVIFLGCDAPDLTRGHLFAAAEALERAPAVIGPAEDGGYYLLGLAHPMPFLFSAMPWGTDRVFALTAARFADKNVPFETLSPLADLDRPEDLARWPALCG